MYQEDLGDVYEPNIADPKKPIVVVLHGGSWIMGNSKSMKSVCEAFQQHGYVAVAPTYTLSSLDAVFLQKVLGVEILAIAILIVMAKDFKLRALLIVVLVSITISIVAQLVMIENTEHNRHPVHVKDFAATCSKIAERYPEQKLILCGHSAGAHLVSLAVTNTRFLPPDILQRIAGVIAISGPYSDKRLIENKIARHLMSSVFSDVSDDVVDAFPIYHIKSTTCPFLLINAGADTSLLLHAKDFFEVLKKQNVQVYTYLARDMCHLSIKENWSSKNRTLAQKAIQFIEKICYDP